VYEAGQCQRCTLVRRVDDLFAPAGHPLPAPLAALRAALVDTDRPKAVLRWLARPATRAVLVDVAAGARPLTHATLDALSTPKAIGYLRAALVAVGSLPDRDEQLVRFESWIAATVARVEPSADRQIVDGYAPSGAR